jgi:Ca2+-binding EF-hand superfamily protein
MESMKKTTLLITATLGFALARPISVSGEDLYDPAASPVKPQKSVDVEAGEGRVKPAPKNCPACAMGLTAEFVFKRLDVNVDKAITVIEFQRSPGMQDKTKAGEAVGRLDKDRNGTLSWQEFETAFKARHANCKQPDPATVAANSARVRPDGRGDGNRFSQVFIMRSDKDDDGRISKSEFRGSALGFDRMDKNKNGFIESDELGELHQKRLADPKSMSERLKSGDIRRPPQDKQPKLSPDNPISPMKLLAGYQQERLESDDTDYGRIFKKGGADFEYDIGPGAFNPNDFASPQDEVRWSRTQVTATGKKVYVELRKDGFLSVFFPESITRFSGRVRGPEDIADILLMVMTF